MLVGQNIKKHSAFLNPFHWNLSNSRVHLNAFQNFNFIFRNYKIVKNNYYEVKPECKITCLQRPLFCVPTGDRCIQV